VQDYIRHFLHVEYAIESTTENFEKMLPALKASKQVAKAKSRFMLAIVPEEEVKPAEEELQEQTEQLARRRASICRASIALEVITDPESPEIERSKDRTEAALSLATVQSGGHKAMAMVQSHAQRGRIAQIHSELFQPAPNVKADVELLMQLEWKRLMPKELPKRIAPPGPYEKKRIVDGLSMEGKASRIRGHCNSAFVPQPVRVALPHPTVPTTSIVTTSLAPKRRLFLDRKGFMGTNTLDITAEAHQEFGRSLL
jgi:hypothetical protein